MRALPILSVALIFTLQLPLMGREPLRSVADLEKLESKVEAVAVKVQPSTVALVSEKVGSSGSGVIVSKDGLILTAAHVVQGAEELTVNFPNGSKATGKVLGANYSKDIGMVKIEEKGPWPFVDLGKSNSLEAGDWVIAMGHSAGFDKFRTPPVRFGRVVSKGPGNFLTTDCRLIGGDSGGPLFDLDGKVIGINSSIGEDLKNNNHAGIDGFQEDWDRLIAGESWGRLEMNPFVNPERPALGIDYGRRRGVVGALVESVVPGSPAAQAGLHSWDLITSIDGDEVRSPQDVEQNIVKRRAGDEVTIGVLRDDQKMEFKATLAKLESLQQTNDDER